jgi:uncharacterized protein YjiS (DUF1127 family)
MNRHHNVALLAGATARVSADFSQGWITKLLARLAALRRLLMAARRRRDTEYQLLELSDAMLKDIGVVRSEISWLAHMMSVHGIDPRRIDM